MSISPASASRQDDSDRLREALVRTLTNLMNQIQGHHRHHMDNNRRNGVLHEEELTRLERIEEKVDRIYALGMFWSDKDD